MWRTSLIVALLAVLAGCSRGADTEPAPAAATPLAAALAEARAEYDRLVAQGPEKTAREVTNLEYPMYLEFMKFNGLEADLGGEEAADAWLHAFFVENERRTNALLGDLPRMIPVAYSGIDLGYSGVADSIVTGGATTSAAVDLWQIAQDQGRTAESHTHSDLSKAEGRSTSVIDETTETGTDSDVGMEWSQDHITVTTESIIQDSSFTYVDKTGEHKVEIKAKDAKGKITTKVKVTTCPDASGKVEAEFESKTELRSTTSAGTGGFIKVTGKMAQWLDDDAELIDDKLETEARVEQTTFDNYNSTHVDVTLRVSTSTGELSTKVNGRSKSATDETVQSAEKVAKMGSYAARSAIQQAKRAWESGHCVDMDVKTNPEKRTGADPGTHYKITVIPRSKSDGQVTTGTVRATLSGDSSLDPADTKVKVEADAKFDYANPKEKDKEASIAFEARSKRGVGKASATFDTKQNSYRIESAICEGGGRETMDVCDVTKPFSVTFCGGTATVKHTPSGEKGGTFSFRFTSPDGHAQNTGTYTLSGEEEKLTATYVNKPVCFTAGGQTHCHAAPSSSVTWTKIDDCKD